MEKKIIKIPSGVHYLSDFLMPDGTRFQLPKGILNKELTGCGGTTLALEDNSKTIICSPRVRLLENKKAQYPDTLLVKGGVYRSAIISYLDSTDNPKILTTYDSLWKVLECIEDVNEWKVVVDEFQCLLNDSSFKADTELKLLEKLKQLPYVTFLSATPILDKYISQISYFDGIPYYKVEWADKYKVDVHRIKSNNPIGIAQNIVRAYQKGNYPTLQNDDGSTTISSECVIFLNSVSNIVNIIKNTRLKPEDVNIVVANNEDNEAIIKKLGEGYGNGVIPLKNEPHKMVTMCTSTAYMGVDFYSTCASTFVISDCNMANTSVDIATELSQIAGRQRLENNPFRYHLHFIYNTSVEDVDESEFEAKMALKMEKTRQEVDYLSKIPDLLKDKYVRENIRNRKIVGYSETYTMWDESTSTFTYNQLAQVNERFAYDVQKYNYQNGVLVKDQLEATGKFNTSKEEATAIYNGFVAHTITNTAFTERMQNYCEMKDSGSNIANCVAAGIAQQHPELKIYYDTLGSKKIKALDYQESKLKEEYSFYINKANLEHKIGMLFKSGDRLPKVEIKARIQMIYNEMGLKKKAKATDIAQFGFTTRDVKVVTNTGRVNGFEITKL